jgi:hypothetical protein
MTMENLGDIVLTSEYWDCECEKNYIHTRSEKKCYTCGAFRSEQPLFRVNEVVASGLPLKTERQPTISVFFCSRKRMI